MSARWGLLGSLSRSHLGDDVSALVDGQLSEPEAERAWAHVMTCRDCRRLVEGEGWLKSRLGSMSQPDVGERLADRLVGSLSDASLYDAEAWSQVDRLEPTHRSRRTTLAVAGVGSVGAAVFGSVTVAGAPVAQMESGDSTVAQMSSEVAGGIADVVATGMDSAAQLWRSVAR